MKRIIVIVLVLISFAAHAQTSSNDRDSVAQSAAFQKKVKMAALTAANNLLADNGQPAFVTQYSQLIISEPNGGSWLPALSYGCMTNPAINSNSSDGDIQFTINSIFVKYAKAYYRITQQ